LEEGAFGIVYKGLFPYGTIVVVKRLKGHVSVVGDTIKMCVQNAGVYRVKKCVSVPSAKNTWYKLYRMRHSGQDTQYMFIRYNFHLHLAYAKYSVHCTFCRVYRVLKTLGTNSTECVTQDKTLSICLFDTISIYP
jgi:hypothetical protein